MRHEAVRLCPGESNLPESQEVSSLALPKCNVMILLGIVQKPWKEKKFGV